MRRETESEMEEGNREEERERGRRSTAAEGEQWSCRQALGGRCTTAVR